MKRDGDIRTAQVGGLAGWLLGRLKATRRPKPRLELLERIALAPKQSLALIEAEGRRFLVATSPEGGPAFYALDDRPQMANRSMKAIGNPSLPARPAARVSW
jgi:flagellar biogenesis protein FliO